MMETRRLGTTELEVTPIALGCWPIAGMTSAGVNDADSLATLAASLDAGINFLDTAYCYGAHGESERLIAQALGVRRDEVIIATKGGIHWNNDREQVKDSSPARLQQELDESLARLATDRVELYYLHAPDRQRPITESAAAIRGFIEQGKVLAAGLSNCTLEELQQFHAVCPVAAYQPHYNMLQREIEADTLPWCINANVSVVIYWPLMKGLLAGRMTRDHVFPADDGRHKYPMFQGDEFQRNLDFVDELRDIADECGKTVSQLVINWTVHQPGITVALCGAKRAAQVEENAVGVGWQLTEPQRSRIDQAIARRGAVLGRSAV
jgi:aryl-alcohol dehydrogenase-like predicted oxidoreductase